MKSPPHPLLGPALLLALLAAIAIPLRPQTPIDETRYISVAWEMWLRGDYLVMFKNGEPYSHKPPLLFWLCNLGWAVTGVNEWWPRLVSPLFSFGCLALTLSIVRRLWPDTAETHRSVLWILASSLLWMLFSTSVMFDVMLTFFALLGIRGLLLAAQGELRTGFAWLALAIGGGVLAKGPVILLHVLPVALLAPWWSPGLDRKKWYAGILLAVLGGVAIGLTWAIPASIRGGEEYRHMIFWGQTANRMVNSFAHKRGFDWYLPLLPLLFFPWLVWPRFWRSLGQLRQPDMGMKLCLAWLLPAFLVFSSISGKQVHYLVPLFPAFALLTARLAAFAVRGGLWLPMSAIIAAAAGMIVLSRSRHLPGMFKEWTPMPAWPGVALLAFVLLAWVVSRRHVARQVPLLAASSAALYAAALCLISANLWQRYDIRPIALEIRKLQDRGIPVACFCAYHAQFHFAGRLEKHIDELGSPEENAAWFRRNPQGILFTYVKKPLPGELLFSHPYLAETGMLVDEAQARAQQFL